MSSIAFLPVTQSQKHAFNFKELSKLSATFLEKASKSIVELSSDDLTEEKVSEEIKKAIESVYKVEETTTKSGTSTSDVKKPKAKRPKQALTSYIYFCNEQRSVLKEENPDSDPKEITKLLAEKWGSLTDKEKEPYVKMHNDEAELLKKKRESGEPEESPSVSENETTTTKRKEKKPAAPKEKKPTAPSKPSAPKVIVEEDDEEEEDDEPILQPTTPAKKAPATKAKK